MKPSSADRRARLPRAIDAGLGQAEAACLVGVGPSTTKRWKRQRRERATLTPAPRPGRTPLIGPEARAAPDATLAAHGATWEAARGGAVSEATMARALARIGWPLDKGPSSPASGTRPSAPPGGKRRLPPPPPTASASTKAAPTGR